MIDSVYPADIYKKTIRNVSLINFAKNILGDNKKARKLNCLSELGE